ncbi:MAG TPA: sugar phosphate isomerase/epimerase family protein [Chloroflexota bacterium]|nr:sugar phosphate isomerase/epimerase family protein [Chloroflexota bacterium]
MRLGAMGTSLAWERTPEGMQPEKILAAAHELGLQVVSLRSTGWEQPGWAERVRGLMERYEIEVELGFGDDYIANGAAQPTDRFAEFIERACKPLGVTVVGTTSPLHGGRWLKAPPLDEQLDRLAAALGRLAPVAEAGGVKLAIENHADYRGYELAAVLERVGSPAVGARLDTANPYAVIEEPLAAAQALAPYTFATHIKDMIVESEPGNRGLTPGGLLGLRHCVLGSGHVDLPAIVDLLAERGPLGEDLWLVLEVGNATIAESVAYARRAFGAHLSNGRSR